MDYHRNVVIYLTIGGEGPMARQELPNEERRERRLEEQIEHLEEDVSRRGFFQKLGRMFGTMFARQKGEGAEG